MFQRTLLFGSFAVLLSSSAHAQGFSFQVIQPQSTVHATSRVELAMPGTVIGDFDAVTNPTGTKTLPGLFGGSGNQPVPMSITLITDLDFQGNPSGSFGAALDLAGGLISIDNLSLDALGGQTGQAGLTLELLYSTFRTFDPTSLYVGGIPLPLPLGQAVVSGLSFTQNAPGAGVLVADPILPNTYAVTALVPADVFFVIDVLGSTTPVGPLPLALPLTGTLVVSGANAQLTLTIQQSATQTIPDPLPGQTIDNLALPVPTILPPGSTANLLFNAVFQELVLDLAANMQIRADGTVLCSVARLCTLSPNSVGPGARIDVRGSPSVSGNDMALTASALPAQRPGVFTLGNQSQQVPFGAGTLCVGGTSYRMSALRSDVLGTATEVIDFQSSLPKFQALTPGSTWVFQYLYRDPAFSGAAYNTSDAVALVFCP
jgi:hypothetical protein